MAGSGILFAQALDPVEHPSRNCVAPSAETAASRSRTLSLPGGNRGSRPKTPPICRALAYPELVEQPPLFGA